MKETMQKTMQAAAIHQFGSIEAVTQQPLPVPEIGPDEILIHLEAAGVGVWDPFEISGGFAEMLDIKPKFPYVPGSEGAGTVEEVGRRVKEFRRGDRVYATALANPKGGFYAEYVAVPANHASRIFGKFSAEQAGAMSVDAVTALQGLDDVLNVRKRESLLIFGASGGVGHLAVQFAKHMGAKVLAVASGQDGAALAKRLGADAAIDGQIDDVLAAAREFAPEGVDAALLTAGGEAANRALEAVRNGGRAAFPNGVEPVPQGYAGLTIQGYDGMPDAPTIDRLNDLAKRGAFEVFVSRTFSLSEASDALRAVQKHHLGKMVLRME